jgi:hypothetical protein
LPSPPRKSPGSPSVLRKPSRPPERQPFGNTIQTFSRFPGVMKCH